MSNYLGQIAARNAGPGQPLLTPAHSPVEKALNDPFDRSAITPEETGRATEEIPTATKTTAAGKEVIVPVQPTNDLLGKAVTPEQPGTMQPAYLSKYLAREQYNSREYSNTVLSKDQGSQKAVRAAKERTVLSIFPSVQNQPAPKQTTTLETINPVQQQKSIITTELVPGQQRIESENLPQATAQPSALQPVAPATQHNTKPALLQPPLPLQPAVNPQKEKPVPALVIGKITVEIIPAQKPVNKIINHVVKPQPPATPTTQRNKHSFGLGQL